MSRSNQQKANWLENICDDCLETAANEYLHLATHKQLRELITQARLRLNGPCTELCEEDCFSDDDN